MKRAVPLGTQVLIFPIDEEKKTASGIILLETANVNTYLKGVVEEKGGGNKWNDMSEIHKGDVVCYSRGAGIPIVRENDEGKKITFLLMDYQQLQWVQ